MTTPQTVIQLGHPTLRQTAQRVTSVQCDRVQKLIDDLIHTTIATNGVGIAAPQVAVSEQIFVVASRPNLRYPYAPHMEPTAMINPEIVAHSEEQVKGWEGCLSVPGIRGLVPRYRSITVAYTDREGQRQQRHFEDFIARIIQHEHDHLNGFVFLDRVESTRDLISEAEFQTRIIDQLPTTDEPE
jgi:peptide deformylase